MDVSETLLELFGRISPLARRVVNGLDVDALTWAPPPGANTIAWLVWHLTRIQDDHVANLLATEQIWVTSDIAQRFGLTADPSNTGYGHTADEVASVRPDSTDVLLEYLEPVDARTRSLLAEITPPDLDRIVDRNWDPPVTMGVRLISVASDCLQHVAQAAYVRGLLAR